jgi:tetratricopeptide (TPR) repeat protein
MMIRHTLLSLIICLFSHAAVPPSDLEKQGREAMAAHLPDVAAARFEARLAHLPADAEETTRLLLLLGESQVRAHQSQKALTTLSHELLRDSSLALFWKAQAHRAEGELQRAIELLDQVITIKSFPYFGEAVLTRSRLLSALGNQRAAIDGLNLLTSTKSALANRAKLDQARLLLITGKTEEARKILPSAKSLKGGEALDAKLLNAALLHTESKFPQAVAEYQNILKSYEKEGEPLPAFIHEAAIGMARARASLNQRTEATDALLSFLQNQPDSPVLDEAFSLLETLALKESAADDPVVSLIDARLKQWSITPQVKLPALLPQSSTGVADRLPTLTEFDHPELHAHALYLRIRQQSQLQEAENLDLLRRLVTQLHWEHPDHPLAQKGTIALARALFREKQFDKAAHLLENLIGYAVGGTAETEAHLLLAREFFRQQNFSEAAGAFEKAAQALLPLAQNNAQFNAGISWLLAGDIGQWQRLLDAATPQLKASLQLEQALLAAQQQPERGLPMLDRFIIDHPNHYRIIEARLAMTFCALDQVPPSIALARTLLDSLAGQSEFSEEILLAQIQLATATRENSAAIGLSRKFLSTYPESPQLANVTLSLGIALYQNGDLNDARQTLQKLEKSHPEKAAPALLIAARAAARTGTPQSLTEAMELFDRIIRSKSSLSAFAALEKARTLIDTKSTASLQLATTELETLHGTLEQSPSLQITAGLLWMETLHALSGSDTKRLQEGLSLQRKLLDHPLLADDDRNRVIYFRGLTLEQLNQADQALDAYYQVIETASKQAPSQWDYFERCGFNAIALLEKNRRWEPAIALAKKLATFPSPRAKEAEQRAERLSLEHMILDQ